MNVNYFNVRLAHKSYRFIRTESRFFEISDCRIQTDGGLNDCDALVVNAVSVPDSTVADLVAQAEIAALKQKKARARHKISRIRSPTPHLQQKKKEEEVVNT